MEDIWKEFWPAAIIIVISIVSGIRNASKTNQRKQDAQPTQPHTLDENFPEVEIFESPVEYSSSSAKPQQPINNRRASKANATTAPTVSKPAEAPEASVAERGAKVALKGKSDVKKAFIYSEIFNRKYT